jgi:hypothetical protein
VRIDRVLSYRARHTLGARKKLADAAGGMRQLKQVVDVLTE